MPTSAKLSLISVTGDDAKTFLQAQLTQDVALWSDDSSVRLSAWCTVKGRMFVSFYVYQTPLGFQLIVAQDMAEKTLQRLKMYVFRSKVNLALLGDALYFSEMGHAPRTINAKGELSLLSMDGKLFGLSTQLPTTPTVDWDTAHIRAGVAWVSAANSEQCVPQAVNFELVGGVNFKKGCYPGQEVVARSQYLGKLRRRAAIAQVQGADIAVMSDVYVQGEAAPVGSVVLSATGWVLIECPHTLIENQSVLTVNRQVLTLHPLPYPIMDVTL